MNPKLVIFGGTGGLGKLITPLLAPDFDVWSFGSSKVRVDSAGSVEDFFENKGYIPNIIYMAVRNHDATLHKLDYYEVANQIEVNIKGFLHVLSFGLPLMRENNYGRIIYVSSILSDRPIPGTGVYAATKAFNDNVVRTCALENAKYNITCNSIQLGYFNAGLSAKVPQDIMAKVLNKIPVRRLGNGDDLNKIIRFILDAPYLTGVNLPYSGGLHLA